MFVRVKTPLLGGVALCLALTCARAADAPAKGPLAPDWLVTVQLGPGVTPAYPGAKAYRPVPIPGIAVRRSNEPERFSAPDDGFGAPILDNGGFRVGPVANVIIPRWRTHQELYGLRKLHAAVELGGFAEYFPIENIRLRAELREGVYGHHGTVATLASDFIGRNGDFLFTSGPRVNFGSTRFTRTYFDVTPWQSLTNGHVPAFKAAGGVTSTGWMSTARYDFAPDWNATVYGGLQRLTGSAGASPIPNILGSRNQFTGGLLLAKTFNVGQF